MLRAADSVVYGTGLALSYMNAPVIGEDDSKLCEEDKMNVKNAIYPVVLAALFPLSAIAGDKPPADAKNILDVAKALQDAGYEQITEIEYDDNYWKAEIYTKEGQKRDIKVDPTTGEIVKDKRDS